MPLGETICPTADFYHHNLLKHLWLLETAGQAFFFFLLLLIIIFHVTYTDVYYVYYYFKIIY